MRRRTAAIIVMAAAAWCLLPSGAFADAGDVAKIRALEARFTAAFNAKDLNAVMKVYMPGKPLFVFDLVPPRQYVGAAAYRKDWEDFFAMFKGPLKFSISELAITAGRTLAFSHSVQHVAGTDANGKPIDITARVTDGYRKIGGRWLIVHEHVSVPVDLATGKPDLMSKP
ncbi:MAG TPA: nuclear transport factor 2 family protein [Stellaceae bacterium]|nr:nuclear transport factor 2 family protein [Stellaceae bacterium]